MGNLVERLRDGWAECSSRRVFLMWSALLLLIGLTIFRAVILSGDLPDGGPFAWAIFIVGASYQDYMTVLVLVTIFLAVGPALPGARSRQGLDILWTLLAITLLFWGFLNIFSVQMLGEPVTRAWLNYSDIGNTDVILDSVFHMLTPIRAGLMAVCIAGFVAGAVVLARFSTSRLTGRSAQVVGLSVVALSFIFAPDPGLIRDGKVANAAVAFASSYFEETRFSFGDDVTPDALRAPPDLGRVDPIARPDAPARAIRNVIVIALEAIPAKYVQGFGGDYPITPNLLRYQASGLSLSRAYAHVPASNYFLVSMLGGIVPELSPDSMTYTYDGLELETLSGTLQRYGYRQGFFNSSDNRFQNTETFVTEAGFDVVMDYRDWDCETGVNHFASDVNPYLNTASDLCTVDAMTRWIATDPDTPFFAMFRTGMSHYPYYPGEDPQTYVEDENLNNFLNAVRVTDEAFGRLMAALEETGLDETTLVVAVGDHGEAFGEHGTYGHASGLNEENVRVPLMLINPVLFDGGVANQIVGMSDLAPTITDLLGLPASPNWQGRSIFAPDRQDGVFFFAPWNGFLVGFRRGDEKFIFNGNSGESWLYDLGTDPGETVDLSDLDPEADAAARALLSDWVAYHNGWIDRRITGGAAVAWQQTPPEGPGTLVVRASGTRFETPPQAEVYLDGVLLGRMSVERAPSNADAAVEQAAIDTTVTSFEFPVEEMRCAGRVEIRFMNDEWEGEGQTGDTNLYIASLEFGGRTYDGTALSAITDGAGSRLNTYLVLWRTGTAALNLYVPGECVGETLTGVQASR